MGIIFMREMCERFNAFNLNLAELLNLLDGHFLIKDGLPTLKVFLLFGREVGEPQPGGMYPAELRVAPLSHKSATPVSADTLR